MIVAGRRGLRFLRGDFENRLGVLSNSMPAGSIDRAVACDLEQPGFRLFRQSVLRPAFQCRDESVAERVLGPGDVPRARRKESNQTTIRMAQDGFDCSMRRGFAHCTGFAPLPAKYHPASGRTSIAVWLAAGCRAAHSRAVSRSGTSIMAMPPRNSF